MAKLLLSRARSKSESRLNRKTRLLGHPAEPLEPLQKFDDAEPLPARHGHFIPRQISNLVANAHSTPKGSFDLGRPKTSAGPQASPKTAERPKTSHGKKSNLEEPSFSMLNRSYTWSREQYKSQPASSRDMDSPMLHAFPPRSSSRQQTPATPDASLEIGVAISSESQHPKTLSDARSSTVYGADDRYSRSLPQHYVSLDSEVHSPASGYASDTIPTSESKDAANRGGWRKFFGKSLFNKKSPQKSLLTQTSQVSVTSTSSTQDTKISLDSVREYSPTTPIVVVETPPQWEPEASSPQQPKLGKSPLLDVDIPKVELERYSVMFDALLNQQPLKPSIYTRRKSGVNGPNYSDDSSDSSDSTPSLSLPKKKENLSLGQLGIVNKSPLWLFPATPRTPKSPGRPRAMTTPTEYVSATTPPATTPETSTFRKPRPESDIVPSLLMMLDDHVQRVNLRNEKDPQTPFSIISENSELDSPYSPAEGSARGHRAPWVRKFSMLDEPEWDMITTTPLKPRTPSPTERESEPAADDGEAYVAKAAKISIARQISISQRQLLLPVISRPERFVSRSRSVKSLNPKGQESLGVEAQPVGSSPPLAAQPDDIAMAL
ncbi:hypothetical protein DRE_06968 [Drechslerella stenobrocha 248]|uniref:Uncharacterized protein n=1 Tax=Drechslerella stenobrocha 248 TaxID=1043628 RepID=W7HWD7_9PEZI|nr:hypothetical protein DRE_06968 [Drechslerella stenobrocha 248]